MNGESFKAKDDDTVDRGRITLAEAAHDEIPLGHHLSTTKRNRVVPSESDNDGGDECEQGVTAGFGQNDVDIETGIIPVPSV